MKKVSKLFPACLIMPVFGFFIGCQSMGEKNSGEGKYIVIASDPPRIEVFIDGKLIGPTPVEIVYIDSVKNGIPSEVLLDGHPPWGHFMIRDALSGKFEKSVTFGSSDMKLASEISEVEWEGSFGENRRKIYLFKLIMESAGGTPKEVLDGTPKDVGGY